MFAGFFLGSPFIISDFAGFVDHVALIMRIYTRPGSPPPIEPTYLWWPKHMVTVEVLPLTILSLLGLGYLLWHRPRETLLLAAYPILYWAMMLTQKIRYSRLWLPTAPILILFAAFALVKLSAWIARALPTLRARHVLALLTLLLVGYWGVAAVQDDWHLAQTDIRTAALSWAEENLPASSKVGVDIGGPPLSPSTWDISYILKAGHYPLNWYEQQGFDYLIISQPVREDPNMLQVQEDNYRTIETRAALIGDLRGVWLNEANQHLWIYKVPGAD